MPPEAVTLAKLECLLPRGPGLLEPREDVKLGGQVCVAVRDHVQVARPLRDHPASLDLREAAGVAATAACGADDDMDASPLAFHPQSLDEWQRLAADPNG